MGRVEGHCWKPEGGREGGRSELLGCVGVVGVCVCLWVLGWQCFVIALEVLDNLPHDKVVWVNKPPDQQQLLPDQQQQQQQAEGWSLHEAIVR